MTELTLEDLALLKMAVEDQDCPMRMFPGYERTTERFKAAYLEAEAVERRFREQFPDKRKAKRVRFVLNAP